MHWATTTKAFPCGHCNGRGTIPCSVCGGIGWYRGGDLASSHHTVKCRHCHNGRIPCSRCDGVGVVVKEIKVLSKGGGDSVPGGMPPPMMY